MPELISIVVPLYKAEAYIADTIENVLHQTYENWELILVDDCSPDRSAQIAEEAAARSEAKGRIRVIRKEKNGGAALARNDGVAAAGGRYIAFLDADDVWLPEKLEREVSFMKRTGAAFACHSYEFGDENAVGTGRIVHVKPQLTYRKALTRTIIFTSTVMFDMTQLSKEEIRMPVFPSEDTALWWELLRKGNIAYGLDEVLTVYRRPVRSLSSDKGVAVRRIWNLYRQREHMGVVYSALCLVGWAVRATLRRL